MKTLGALLAAGALLAPNAAAAATELYLAGINGKAPNRAAITAQKNTVKPVEGSASERSYIQVQYLETPVDSEGKQAYALASLQVVDCVKHTARSTIIVTLDNQNQMITRGKSDEPATVPPPRSFAMMLINATCTGDWSKLQSVPDQSVSATRAKFFGSN